MLYVTFLSNFSSIKFSFCLKEPNILLRGPKFDIVGPKTIWGGHDLEYPSIKQCRLKA